MIVKNFTEYYVEPKIKYEVRIFLKKKKIKTSFSVIIKYPIFTSVYIIKELKQPSDQSFFFSLALTVLYTYF